MAENSPFSSPSSSPATQTPLPNVQPALPTASSNAGWDNSTANFMAPVTNADMNAAPNAALNPATNPNGATSWNAAEWDGAASTTPANAPSAPGLNVVQLIATRSSGAKWFYWIAGLSLINSLIMAFGADFSFGLGLGSTLIVDAVVKDLIVKQPNLLVGARIFEMLFDGFVIGLFVLFGAMALRGKKWAFICGALLIALDTLLVLSFSFFIGVAIHIWALISIYAGYAANQKIEEQIKANAAQNGSWSSPLPTP